MNQYEKVKKRYPNGMVTLSKSILRFCPSDLLEDGADDCEPNGKETDEQCRRCWFKEVKNQNE